jgi:hypothetical protein
VFGHVGRPIATSLPPCSRNSALAALKRFLATSETAIVALRRLRAASRATVKVFLVLNERALAVDF